MAVLLDKRLKFDVFHYDAPAAKKRHRESPWEVGDFATVCRWFHRVGAGKFGDRGRFEHIGPEEESMSAGSAQDIIHEEFVAEHSDAEVVLLASPSALALE